MRSPKPIGTCIGSTGLPGRTNWICGHSRSVSRSQTQPTKKEKNMGLQNEKIAASSFVTADLNYLAPPLDRPRTYTFEPPSGEPKSNIVPEPHSLPIHDVRPIGETVSLDREGFALVRQNSSVKDFYDEDEVKNVYYPEAERLIKAATGADRVFVFDPTVGKRVQWQAHRDGGMGHPGASGHGDHTR